MPVSGEGASNGSAGAGSGAAGAESRRWTDAAISADTGVPLYIQIRNLLKEQLRLGEWQADEPMPTEDQLVTHFGVSRTTVRQAMTDLAREGLVVRKAGRGTFARQPLLVLRMQQWHSLGVDITRRGFRSTKLTLCVEKLDAGAEIAHRASEFAERDVLHIQQVRYADGVPIVVFDHYFPFELCGFLAEMPLDDPDFSIQRALAEHGIELARAKGEITRHCGFGPRGEVPRARARQRPSSRSPPRATAPTSGSSSTPRRSSAPTGIRSPSTATGASR